ncbi:MAG: hypothetical protein ACSHX4_00005 [Opitutaceae bacterium]
MPTPTEINFTSDTARKRVESWPVCPRRVRYYQYESEGANRTYGQFTVDARLLGSHLNVYITEMQRVNLRNERLIEWFLDADQNNDAVLDLPRQWTRLDLTFQKFVRRIEAPCFCVACNREYPMNELERMDDRMGSAKGSCLYDRLICPEDHLLHEVLRIRLIKRIKFENPSFQEVMANLDEDGNVIDHELHRKWGFDKFDLDPDAVPKTLKFRS